MTARLLALWLGAVPAPLALTDDVGRTLVLPAPPRRIVSTAPSNTEALFALGVGDRVVGVSRYCVNPPEARARTQVGDFSSIDFEKVLHLEPDLVVATWLEQRRAVEELERLGLRVLVLYPATLQETRRSLLLLGRAVGAEARARELVADMDARLEAIDRRVGAIPAARRPAVFVELSASPLYTAGPGSTVHELIERAGGRNIAADLGKPYGPMSREVVIARDPDFILLGSMGDGSPRGSSLEGEPGFGKLKAFQAGHVLGDADPAILFHQNHRLVEGVEWLHRRLHPQATPAPRPARPSRPPGSTRSAGSP